MFGSSLLAVATDLCDVVICDMETRTVVRQFTGHNMRITDMVCACVLYITDMMTCVLVFHLRWTMVDNGWYGLHH